MDQNNQPNEPLLPNDTPTQYTPSDYPQPNTASADSTELSEQTYSSQTEQPTPPVFNNQPLQTPQQQLPQQPAHNPGQTLGIVSIILSFVGLSLVGLILGIVSRRKSKEVNSSPTLGTVGIVIGIVFTILGAIIAALIVISMLAYTGIQDRGNDSRAQSSAYTIVKRAEAYYTMNQMYPATISDFESTDESSISDSGIDVSDKTPNDSSAVQYKQCDAYSAQVSYYNTTNNTVAILPLGSASSSTAC